MIRTNDNQPPRLAVPTNDLDAISINSLANDVERMAEVGLLLRKVYTVRLYSNKRYFRAWVGKHCNFSVASALRYMTVSQHRHELRRASIVNMTDAYRQLDLAGQISVSYSSPLWDRAGVPVDDKELGHDR